jgi:Transposase IS116/IS110/IS902 family
VSRFPTGRHAASWTAICPGNHESAGKRKSGRRRNGNPHLRAALTNERSSPGRDYLERGSDPERMTRRPGQVPPRFVAGCRARPHSSSSRSCAGLMLPPLQRSATRWPASRSRSLRTAASGAAPAGSTRVRVSSIRCSVAARSSSSATRTKSSRCSARMRWGSSNETRVYSPSANVWVSSATGRRSRHAR